MQKRANVNNIDSTYMSSEICNKNNRNSSALEATAFSEAMTWKVVIKLISIKNGQTFIGFHMNKHNKILYLHLNLFVNGVMSCHVMSCWCSC